MSGLEGLLAGRVLGDRYRILEVIGRGGMGAVYRGVDERLGRQVAVKVVTATGASDAESRDRLRARFQREARAAAALPHHPNVVPVYDYGTDQALGLDYIVMELLRGNDLATRLARTGPPPLPAALTILYEAARGLAVGHRAGLIHRDVKPGNIFLAESDHQEVQVRVVDFGIAKLAEDEDTFGQLTQDGRVPHSPAFASPEQLRGLGRITAASDVFSLGAVGYTLLTGQRPFSEGDRNQMALGMPVAARPVRALNPAVPTAIEQIVARALAYEPEQRYPDAGAMADALAGALRSLPDTPLEPYAAGAAAAGLPPRADDEHTRVLGGPDDDRTRAFPAGAAPDDDRTLLAPDAAARATSAAPPVPPRPLPPRAEPEKRRGIGGLIVWALVLLVLGAAAAWIVMESSGGPQFSSVEEAIPPAPDTLPSITPEIVEEELGGQPALDAVVHNEEGKRLLNAGDAAGALEQFRLAAELAPEVPDYHYNYGLALLQAEQPADAAAQFQRVLALEPGRTGAHYNLGLARLAMGDTAAAWTALQQAVQQAATPAERAAAARRLREIEAAQAAQAIPAPTDTGGFIPVVPPVIRDTARTPSPTAARRDTAAPRAARPDSVTTRSDSFPRLLGRPVRPDTSLLLSREG